jgi:hypothetical protein
MKKIIVALLIAMFPIAAFAQVGDVDIAVSGLGKSGVYYEKTQRQGWDAEEQVKLHSKDDAGDNQGRFRLNLDFTRDNMGIRTRWQWDNWGQGAPQWSYAFAYGNFFDDQLTTSVGKLGESPWATGGPEMWRELEISARGGGMRTEYKPSFAPGLNVGFVLNFFNDPGDQGWPESKPYTLMEILKESVVGISYTHEYFLFRFAFRFDSVADAIAGNIGGVGEEAYVFRIEERIIKNYLPGFQIWALGYGVGLRAPKEYNTLKLENWLFAQYDPELFTAQIRFGYDYLNSRSILHFRPSFYWKFFNNLLNVGVMFKYQQDFGDGKVYEGSPYYTFEIEPKIQVNFGNSNNYIAFAYNYGREYIKPYDLPDGMQYTGTPIKQIQWMNLRFCLQL